MAKAFAIHSELPWQKPVGELRVKATASINYQTKQPFRKKNTGKLPVKFCNAYNVQQRGSSFPIHLAHIYKNVPGKNISQAKPLINNSIPAHLSL